MRKFFILLGTALLGISLMAQTGVADNKSGDYLLFSQTSGDKPSEAVETIYEYHVKSSELQKVVSGKNISVSFGSNWMLYYMEGKLYQYNPKERNSKLVATINAEEVSAQVLPGETEQALVVTSQDGFIHWYILDFSDGSLRPIARPTGGTSSGSLETSSPDGMFAARLHGVAFSQRFDLEVRKQSPKGSRIIWRLPQDLTVLPERPLWAPDSQNIAFYAKKSDGNQGFYSLYLFQPETLKLNEIAHQVFNKILFESLRSGPFSPGWSHDGKNLLFIDQPFGLPTESAVVKYETSTGKKTVIATNKWNYQYPSWALSDRFISVLASRNGSGNQLYIMNPNGDTFRKISPDAGSCIWAQWMGD